MGERRSGGRHRTNGGEGLAEMVGERVMKVVRKALAGDGVGFSWIGGRNTTTSGGRKTSLNGRRRGFRGKWRGERYARFLLLSTLLGNSFRVSSTSSIFETASFREKVTLFSYRKELFPVIIFAVKF